MRPSVSVAPPRLPDGWPLILPEAAAHPGNLNMRCTPPARQFLGHTCRRLSFLPVSYGDGEAGSRRESTMSASRAAKTDRAAAATRDKARRANRIAFLKNAPGNSPAARSVALVGGLGGTAARICQFVGKLVYAVYPFEFGVHLNPRSSSTWHPRLVHGVRMVCLTSAEAAVVVYGRVCLRPLLFEVPAASSAPLEARTSNHSIQFNHGHKISASRRTSWRRISSRSGTIRKSRSA
jgi:hypothetical protein